MAAAGDAVQDKARIGGRLGAVGAIRKADGHGAANRAGEDSGVDGAVDPHPALLGNADQQALQNRVLQHLMGGLQVLGQFAVALHEILKARAEQLAVAARGGEIHADVRAELANRLIIPAGNQRREQDDSRQRRQHEHGHDGAQRRKLGLNRVGAADHAVGKAEHCRRRQVQRAAVGQRLSRGGRGELLRRQRVGQTRIAGEKNPLAVREKHRVVLPGAAHLRGHAIRVEEKQQRGVGLALTGDGSHEGQHTVRAAVLVGTAEGLGENVQMIIPGVFHQPMQLCLRQSAHGPDVPAEAVHGDGAAVSDEAVRAEDVVEHGVQIVLGRAELSDQLLCVQQRGDASAVQTVGAESGGLLHRGGEGDGLAEQPVHGQHRLLHGVVSLLEDACARGVERPGIEKGKADEEAEHGHENQRDHRAVIDGMAARLPSLHGRPPPLSVFSDERIIALLNSVVNSWRSINICGAFHTLSL